MKALLIISFAWLFPFNQSLNISFNDTLTVVQGVSTTPCKGCGDRESLEIRDIPDYSAGDWSESWGPSDGTHYVADVEFTDGVRGRMFKGGNSGKLFIENSNGTNFYYLDGLSAVRALYLYKKYGCITDKYRSSVNRF